MWKFGCPTVWCAWSVVDQRKHTGHLYGARNKSQSRPSPVFFTRPFSVNTRYYKEICAVYNLVKIHARGWLARRLHTRKSTFLTRPYLEIYVPYMKPPVLMPSDKVPHIGAKALQLIATWTWPWYRLVTPRQAWCRLRNHIFLLQFSRCIWLWIIYNIIYLG